MKRRIMSLTAIAVLALAASALAKPAHSPTVKLAHTGAGRILVNGHGFTIFEFSRDSRNRDRCAAISNCPGTWPALTVKGKAKPVAGPGLKASLIGTITLPGGARQVTYAGHPLYTYSFDTGPGATDYIGANQFHGNWYALSATGEIVK